MKVVVKYGLIALFVAGSGVFFTVPSKYLKIPKHPRYVGGEIVNGKQYAQVKNTEYYSDQEDEAEVEETWGEAIPERLLQVGGADLYSWSSIYHDRNDPPHIFRGEFRDREKLYKGKFEYFQPEGKPLPDRPLGEFYMAGPSSDGVHFYAISSNENVAYFLLKPTGQIIYSDTPEAELFRKTHTYPSQK